MDNPGEILRLCRLCLVKDQVNIPIFEEQGDIRQTFLKIRSCLPVKVSRDDKLPKKICGGCSNKLDLFYEFWSSTANSEKTLQSWLGQEEEDDKMQEITKPVEALVKEESEALEDGHAHDQSFDEATKDEAEAPPAKRARRTAAVKAQINISHDSDEDEDVDGAEPITKIEDESDDSDGEEKDPSYTEVPGTSADDQAGPSGLGKDGVEAPSAKSRRSKRHLASKALTGISFQCSDCHSKFISLSFLKIHMENDCPGTKKTAKNLSKNKVWWKCTDCNKKFISLENLKSHLINNCPHVNNKPKKLNVKPMDLLRKLPSDISAKVVKPTYSSKRSADSKLISSGKFFFVCQNCPQIFSSQKALDEHSEKCNLSEYFIKKKSQKSSGEAYTFNRFNNVYVCSKCNQKFDFKTGVEEHIKVAHTVFVCPDCEKTFEQLIHYGYHTSKHHPQGIMTCPSCFGFNTKVKPELAFHIQTEHASESTFLNPNMVRFSCVVCCKTFYNERKLFTHQKNYHKANIEVLPSMGARFIDKSLKSDTPQSMLCDNCGKNFSSKYRLERHQRAMHMGLKPFICRYCGRAFTGKDTMKKHERIHTGEKPYSCEYCGKCFRQPGPFAVHLRIHTGERPYQCKFCKKGFITNQMKKSHIKNCSVRAGPEAEYTDYVFLSTADYA
ncbi:oocyte zinc finger protein XlCOF6-like isoform X7 [Euwallacea similis]|uniref:oocyte zinc finger protein XlCOF6-like isoform X7 n=1 Tax=Euwallacea similis TaxID=1736056 RepID=UPI00344D540D